MLLKQSTVHRKYKNNLFIYLFTRKKEYALSLYNAVNGSNYTNEKDLQFKLLEDVLFIEMKNDVSFLFDGTLNLYEHQSTFSYNMPLRGLFYLADLYRKLIQKERLYRKKRIRIPTPKYVEFLKEHGEEMSEMSWRIYDTEKILQIQHEEALEDAREEGREEGIALGRAEAEHNAEKIIHALQQEIEKLKGQLALQA